VIETADAVVIGAGIVGAACADALSRERLRVAVVEAAAPGSGATGAGMGHIVVMDDSEPQFALTRYSRALWLERRAGLPREAEFELRGTIWIAAGEEEIALVNTKAELYAARAVRAQILDGRELAVAEPNLRQGLAGGLLVPDDGVLYAPCAAQWLLESSGATLRMGTAVTALTSDGVTLNDGARISAGVVVCAAGNRTNTLVPGLAIRPRKGHLAITDRYPAFVHHQLVELGYLKSAHGAAAESVAFNVQPRATGQVLIGSSRQYDRMDPGVDRHILSRMLRRALDYMPALERLRITRVWTGFRGATEDNLPLIGPCPGRGNVFLAAGHEGLGITTALGTAALIADLVLGREPAIDPRPYAPSRTLREAIHG
jgi:glycine/D-amino acid oxidase-like deaminating enzyme